MDVHKNDVVVVAVDSKRQRLMPEERIPMACFVEWVEKHITKIDEVALEVTTNA